MSLVFLLEKHLSGLMASLGTNFLLLQQHLFSFHLQVGEGAWLHCTLLCKVLVVGVVICKMVTLGLTGGLIHILLKFKCM